MPGIVQVDGSGLEWRRYERTGSDPDIRYKRLTPEGSDAPPVQYVSYGPEETDPIHRHDVAELFLVTEGELWLDGRRSGPGGMIYIAPDTDYSIRAGTDGAVYFRVVTDDQNR